MRSVIKIYISSCDGTQCTVTGVIVHVCTAMCSHEYHYHLDNIIAIIDCDSNYLYMEEEEEEELLFLL